MRKCLNKSQKKTLKSPLYAVEDSKSKDIDDCFLKEPICAGLVSIVQLANLPQAQVFPRYCECNEKETRSLLLWNSYSVGERDKEQTY